MTVFEMSKRMLERKLATPPELYRAIQLSYWQAQANTYIDQRKQDTSATN